MPSNAPESDYVKRMNRKKELAEQIKKLPFGETIKIDPELRERILDIERELLGDVELRSDNRLLEPGLFLLLKLKELLA